MHSLFDLIYYMLRVWFMHVLYRQERCPPLIEDFLYICDDAYTRQEFIQMEMNILRIVGFDLGMPLSYRFLRRYAKVGLATQQITGHTFYGIYGT